MTAQQPAGDSTLLIVNALQMRTGRKLRDGGNFEYTIQPAGTFLITAAPKDYQHSIGVTIGLTHRAWPILADLVLNDAQCMIDPDGGQSIGAPAPAPAPPPDQSVGSPSPSPSPAPVAPQPEPGGKDGGKDKPPVPSNVRSFTNDKGNLEYDLVATPLAAGDLAQVTIYSAPLKLVTPASPWEAQGAPDAVMPQAYVRVLELASSKGMNIARIELLAGPNAKTGTELGWVRAKPLVRLARPARPTIAAQQMDKLVAVARAYKGAQQHGVCFTFVKNYIAIAGGYGDFLDIHTDPRFFGMKAGGKDFAAFVEGVGLALLGLEKVGGAIWDQAPGTILCTQGNDGGHDGNGKNGISKANGDIAVIDKVVGGVVRCYNDATIDFEIAEKNWASGGKLEGSVVGMYRPIDRPVQ